MLEDFIIKLDGFFSCFLNQIYILKQCHCFFKSSYKCSSPFCFVLPLTCDNKIIVNGVVGGFTVRVCLLFFSQARKPSSFYQVHNKKNDKCKSYYSCNTRTSNCGFSSFNFVDGFLAVILKWLFVLPLVDRFFCEEVFLVVHDVSRVNDDVVVFSVLLMC